MPVFTFSGFPLGSSVALSAAQGGATASGSVPTWGQNSMASAGIQTTTQSIVTAPAPVWFEANNLSGFNVGDGPPAGENYDPSFHEITYVWTIRDAPLQAWSKVTNLVTGWNDPNVAYGKRVAFCFPLAGTYTVDLWAVDSEGTTATATTTVSVVDGSDAYSPSNTIVFALDGNFAGAPTGSQVTTISSLRSLIESRNAPTRVSFKPGEVVPNVDLFVDNGYLSYVDTWTPGSTVELHVPPTGSSTMFTYWNDAQDTNITFRDLVMKANWDPTTETGIEGGGFDFNLKPVGATVLIYNCDLVSMGYAISMSIGHPSQFMVANCRIQDWKHYAMYSFFNPDAGSKFALLGVEAAQNPLALAGGPKENMSNDHGPVRLERAEEIYISGCDFFSCTGWSGSPPRAANACLRLNSKGYDGTHVTVERTTLEGGYIQIKCDGENNGTPEFPGNFLFDKILCIGTCRSIGFAGLHFGGTTVRNALMVMPTIVPYYGLTNPFNFIHISPNNPQPGNLDAPMRFYNNSFISFLDQTTPVFFSDGASLWSDFTDENNIHYIPNAGVTPNGAVDMTTPLLRADGEQLRPRFSQVRWNYALESGSVGTVPNGGTISIPYSSIGRQNELGEGPSGATDQAYWQTAAAAGDNLHMINFGNRTFYAAIGEMTVSFASGSNIVITNTSGTDWSGSYFLRLDRKSYLDSELPAQTQYENPATLPTCRPLSAPGTQDTLGLVAYDDVLRAVRSQPISRGAVRY